MRSLKIEQQFTPRNSLALNNYLKDIGDKKFDPITIEQEIELFKKMKSGDKEAKEKLINANIRYKIYLKLLIIIKLVQNEFVALKKKH